MGVVSRQHESGIVAGAPHDAIQFSSELDNIIGAGVNDNWDREGLADEYVGDISINENATRIDVNEVDIAAQEVRVAENESDLAENTQAIAENTAHRLGYKRMMHVTATSGFVSLTTQDIRDNDVLLLTGLALTGLQTVYLPTPTSSADGLVFEIWPLGSGSATNDRILSGNNVVDFEGEPYPGSIDIGTTNRRNIMRLVVAEVKPNTYRWTFNKRENF